MTTLPVPVPMTLAAYEKTIAPVHGAQIHFWTVDRFTHTIHRYRLTYYVGRVAWADHPWSDGVAHGAGFEQEWAIEEGRGTDGWQAAGRDRPWRRGGRMYATREEAAEIVERLIRAKIDSLDAQITGMYAQISRIRAGEDR